MEELRIEPDPQQELATKRPKIWAVGSGKGGVGKSLISANFAVTLARHGRRVLALDLDLGGANLHTCLGVDPPKMSIGDWVSDRSQNLSELFVPTREPGLVLLSGTSDSIQIIEQMGKRHSELMKLLREQTDFDDIVMDLGAGTHGLTIEFFSAADQGILSILPEPTSVENAYRFIRSVYFNLLKNSEVAPGIHEVIDAAMDPKNILGLRTPADLLTVIDRLDPEAGSIIHSAVKIFSPTIVINQVRSQIDIDVGRAICSVCKRYFGIEVRYAGYLEYDNSVWKAVRAKKAFVHEFPHTLLASRIDTLTRTLLGEEKGLFP